VNPVLSANNSHVVVLPVPGVPVTRILGRCLIDVSIHHIYYCYGDGVMVSEDNHFRKFPHLTGAGGYTSNYDLLKNVHDPPFV
jgi:hypothetical protein